LRRSRLRWAGDLKYKSSVRADFAASRRRLAQDGVGGHDGGGEGNRLSNLETDLLQVPARFRNRAAHKIWTHVGQRRFSERNEDIHRRALRAGASGRRVLRHDKVWLAARPVDGRDVAYGQSPLDGGNLRGSNRVTHELRDFDPGRSQTYQNVNVLARLYARVAWGDLRNDLIGSVLIAEELVLNRKFQTQSAGDSLRRFERHAHQVRNRGLMAVDRQAYGGDRAGQRHRDHDHEKGEKPKQRPKSIAQVHVEDQ